VTAFVTGDLFSFGVFLAESPVDLYIAAHQHYIVGLESRTCAAAAAAAAAAASSQMCCHQFPDVPGGMVASGLAWLERWKVDLATTEMRIQKVA